MDALVPLLRNMSRPCPLASVEARATKIVCSMVRNNLRSQRLVMEAGGLKALLDTYLRVVDATTETDVLSAICSIFQNNIRDPASRQCYYELGLSDCLRFTALADRQRKALKLIHCLVVERKSDCNIVTGLRYHHLMLELADSYFASIRVAALECLLLLTQNEQNEGDGINDQLVKNDDKLKQVLKIWTKFISRIASSAWQSFLEVPTLKEIQLVDSLWNACYDEPSSLQDLLADKESLQGLLATKETQALGHFC